MINTFLEERVPETSQYPFPINIYEEDNNVYVVAPCSGIKKENIEIEYKQNNLFITWRKNIEKKEGRILRNEREEGEFSRGIPLPVEVNGESIQAKYENGVLVLSMAKREEARPRQITIE
jgi:HSP20 family protein